jgi:hypothetical protein
MKLVDVNSQYCAAALVGWADEGSPTSMSASDYGLTAAMLGFASSAQPTPTIWKSF